MIRLGLRLAIAGGREAITRLALIAIAVAFGVGLLLTTLASLNAVNRQNSRYAWLETSFTGSNAAASTGPQANGVTTKDALWWRLSADYYQGKEIGRIDLAATGANSPTPPGIAALPGPGEFYASPALAKLLRDTPADQLADRFPGSLVGTIGPAALPAPNSLIIVIGRRVADLSHQDDVGQVTSISTTTPSNCTGDCAFGVGTDANGITLILSVVAAALLFPVLIFIGAATRLSAARREQRFAAMRLVGATPRQISVMSTVESSVASIVGVAAGFGLFYALRPALATIPFTGAPFFGGDLYLSLGAIVLVALGIPIAAAAAARLALRRVTISPLGVSRRVTPRAPRVWRVVPLLAGIVELGDFAYFNHIGGAGKNTHQQAAAYLSGVLLIMAGLVIAGPWLTMVGSRLMARRANRPATLIAGRRLADNPQAAFRAISGLVLAVFVGTCALGIVTTIAAYDGGTASATAASTGTVIDQFGGPGQTSGDPAAVAGTLTKLAAVPGVTGVAVIHRTGYAGPTCRSRAGEVACPVGPADATVGPADGTVPQEAPGPAEQVVSCAQLAGTTALGHCPPGTDVVAITPDFGGSITNGSSMSDITWHAADMSETALPSLPIDSIAVGTNGSAAAVEQARTLLEIADAGTKPYPPFTLSEYQIDSRTLLHSYEQLADVVILTSLPIAGCSLAVSVAGGVADRKRAFSLLRLSGAPLAMLRRVITLEAAAPLLITAIVSIGAGLLAAQLFLRAQLSETLQPPSLQYYVITVAGLLASLAIIASTLPLLKRTTGPGVARNE